MATNPSLAAREHKHVNDRLAKQWKGRRVASLTDSKSKSSSPFWQVSGREGREKKIKIKKM